MRIDSRSSLRGKLAHPPFEQRPRVVRPRARLPDGTAATVRAAPDTRALRPCRRRARRASPRATSAASTQKPWFCAVTSTRPLSRSSTGWFAPRWPNGSFDVVKPVARPSSWWPRQIPSTGTRPSELAHDRRLGLERLRVAGPVREEHAVVGGELVRVDVVRIHRDGRARAREAAQDRPLAAVVDDGDARRAGVAEDVRLLRRDVGDERAAAHLAERARGRERLVDRAVARRPRPRASSRRRGASARGCACRRR